jgi:hypothetical protein
MRKFFLVIWGINSVALVCLFGAILLYGGTPDRKARAGDLAEIWVGLAVVYGWVMFTTRRKAKQETEKAAAAREAK